MSIDVSVIIVNFKQYILLEQCLDSLLKVTKGINYEIIVVDNESDFSGAISNKYPNVRLLEENENLGFAGGNNKAVKISRGKYILFLNNDTIFLENTILKLVEFAKTKSEQVFVGCQLVYPDNSLQVSALAFPDIWYTLCDSLFLSSIFKSSTFFNKSAISFQRLQEPTEVDIINGAFMLCDGESVRKLNGFDERFFFYAEEYDLCRTFKKNGGKIYFYPGTSIVHIGGATVRTRGKFFYKNHLVGRLQFFQKHFLGVHLSLLIILVYLGILIRIPLYFILGVLTFDPGSIKKTGYYIYQLSQYPTNKFR